MFNKSTIGYSITECYLKIHTWNPWPRAISITLLRVTPGVTVPPSGGVEIILSYKRIINETH